MAWPTRKNSRDFSRTLGEPDMETLTYWVQRLEPLVRAELDREIIVIFCNRSGQEDSTLYAGTSAVIGIKEGEASVYALAGRGTKEFLFVDTSDGPFAKLVQNEDEDIEAEEVGDMVEHPEAETNPDSVDPTRWASVSAKWPVPPTTIASPSNASAQTTNPGSSAPTAARAPPARREKPSPQLEKLQIPLKANFSHRSRLDEGEPESPTTLATPTIPTPTAPSPTPLAMRPKLVIPEQKVITAGFSRKPSPYPHDKYFLEQHRFFGNRVQAQIFTPVTPFQEEPAPLPPAQVTTRFYWRPADTLLKTPANMNFNFADTPAPDSTTAQWGMSLGSLTPFPSEDLPPALPARRYATQNNRTRRLSTSLKQLESLADVSPNLSIASPLLDTTRGQVGFKWPESRDEQEDQHLPRPSNPVSRTQNRTREEGNREREEGNRTREEGNSTRSATRQGLGIVTQDLDDLSGRRTASAADNRAAWLERSNDSIGVIRTDSPKARHASRPQHVRQDSKNKQRFENINEVLHPKAKSSSPPQSAPLTGRPPSRAGKAKQVEVRKPASRAISRPEGGSVVRQARSRSAGTVPRAPSGRTSMDTVRHRSSSRSPPGGGRSVSRGRQRRAGEQSPPLADSKQASASLTHDTKDTMLITRRVSVTRIHSSSKPAGVRKATPDDDIVAVEEYVDPTCGQHSERAPSVIAPPLKMPSIADGRAILGANCHLPPPPPIYYLQSESRAHTPIVLGGTVKTTIIPVPENGSDGLLPSPPPSASSGKSTSSMASQASQTTTTPTATPISRNTTPDNASRLVSQGAQPFIASRLADEKRVDTPIPDVCDRCGSPRIGPYSDDEGARSMVGLW